MLQTGLALPITLYCLYCLSRAEHMHLHLATDEAGQQHLGWSKLTWGRLMVITL
jgi:hypothetical protein